MIPYPHSAIIHSLSSASQGRRGDNKWVVSLVNLSLTSVQHPPFQQLPLLNLIYRIWITFSNSLTFRSSFPVETASLFERTLFFYLGQFIEWTLLFLFPLWPFPTRDFFPFRLSKWAEERGEGGVTGDQRRTTQSAEGQKWARETFIKRWESSS